MVQGDGLVTMRVFDVRGKELGTLVNERFEPGNYEVTFAARDLSERSLLLQAGISWQIDDVSNAAPENDFHLQPGWKCRCGN